MEPRKHYFAKIPTIAIFIVMAMSGPLGVLLFILKDIDQKMQRLPVTGATTAPTLGRSPTGRASLSTATISQRQSRKVQSSGIKILPSSAPSWVPFSCLPG